MLWLLTLGVFDGIMTFGELCPPLYDNYAIVGVLGDKVISSFVLGDPT